MLGRTGVEILDRSKYCVGLPPVLVPLYIPPDIQILAIFDTSTIYNKAFFITPDQSLSIMALNLSAQRAGYVKAPMLPEEAPSSTAIGDDEEQISISCEGMSLAEEPRPFLAGKHINVY